MIDLETLATTPDAHILTIAARAFDPDTGKVAEAIELALNSPTDATERELRRQIYLEEKSPRRYAELLLAILRESS